MRDDVIRSFPPPTKARVYFLAYTLCICFTTIQMVVNVIISNYQDLAEMAGLPVTDQDMENFQDIWKLYDPLASGSIPIARLGQVRCRLG